MRFEKILLSPYHRFKNNDKHKGRLYELLSYFQAYKHRLDQLQSQSSQKKYKESGSTCTDSITVLSSCLRLPSDPAPDFGPIHLLLHDYQTYETIDQLFQGGHHPQVRHLWDQWLTKIHHQQESSEEVQDGPIRFTPQNLRKGCEGYMMVIRLTDEIQMTMSVWISEGAQEHALIMKNLFSEHRLPPLSEKLSIIMHSFAATAIGQPLIYCQPMDMMKTMLIKTMKQKQIPYLEYVNVTSQEDYHPCRMFGTDLIITNDTQLKTTFTTFIGSIGISSSQQKQQI